MRNFFYIFIIIIVGCQQNEKNMNIKFKKNKLSNGESIESSSINEVQYLKYLKDLKLKRIYNSLTTDDPELLLYELPDGNILVSSDGYNTIYKNLNDLIKVINDYTPQGIEILHGLNPYKDKFPENVNDLISEIWNDLGLNVDEKNYLDALDISINKTEKEIFDQKHFINYIALIGDKLINQYGGEWKMILSSDGETWNPYIVVNNINVDIVAYMYEDIIVNGDTLKNSYLSISDVINYR